MKPISLRYNSDVVVWLTYMSSGLTLDALILNVRDLQAALPIILRAEQQCVDVPIFFLYLQIFSPASLESRRCKA